MDYVKLAITCFLSVAAACGQEAVVDRSSIWIDTVKRGDMNRAVRGLGTFSAGPSVELQIAETQAKDIKPGQTVTIDTRNGLLNGKVRRVAAKAENGTVPVEVAVDGKLPAGVTAGLSVDGAIHIEVLRDVVYVGRPVLGSPGAQGMLFRLDADGQHASRVNVHYGRASINALEIRSGLQPGDKVILSDTTAFAEKDRVRLR